LSYEFQKPFSADVNITLAGYVQNGGILYYCGDGRDPFHVLKRQSPADLCLNTALSDAYRGDIAALLGVTLDRNSFVLRRGPYLRG
jgi:hypothetical protein